jgi:hypothetical protein
MSALQSAHQKVNIDKTFPTIKINIPPNNIVYVMNTTLTADYGCTDALSGPAICSGQMSNGRRSTPPQFGSFNFTVSL